MITIHKYHLELGRNDLHMPAGAQVLTAQTQHGALCLWARVDTSRPLESRAFDVYGTGTPMPADPRAIYVATVQMAGGALVWHIFEVVPQAPGAPYFTIQSEGWGKGWVAGDTQEVPALEAAARGFGVVAAALSNRGAGT